MDDDLEETARRLLDYINGQDFQEQSRDESFVVARTDGDISGNRFVPQDGVTQVQGGQPTTFQEESENHTPGDQMSETVEWDSSRHPFCFLGPLNGGSSSNNEIPNGDDSENEQKVSSPSHFPSQIPQAQVPGPWAIEQQTPQLLWPGRFHNTQTTRPQLFPPGTSPPKTLPFGTLPRSGTYMPQVSSDVTNSDTRNALMAAPFQNHMGTKVNPCVIINGVSGPCHLLACGHIVIINHGNWSCAQNCRHVVDSNSLGHPRFNGHTLTDHLYCTICNQNEPITIFKARHAQSADIQNLRHTMPMTRETLKSVPGFCAERLEYEPPLSILCLEYSHYDGNGIDPMHTHRLLCGHEVFVWPSRPCAANCHQAEPRCRGHAHPQNRVQADAILCQLCVQKAESGVAQYRWPRTL